MHNGLEARRSGEAAPRRAEQNEEVVELAHVAVGHRQVGIGVAVEVTNRASIINNEPAPFDYQPVTRRDVADVLQRALQAANTQPAYVT